MKFAGIALFWVGIVMLLKNIGLIQEVNSNLYWAVALIVVGSALKHGCHHGMCGGMMGKWKCGMGESHKCMGANCTECNK
jgi:hypothetical protein